MGAHQSKDYQYCPLKQPKTGDHDHNNEGTINQPCFKKTEVLKSPDLISGSPIVDDQYDFLNPISSGSYGAVHRARDKKTGEIVAIKKELDGKCLTSLREIEILKSLNRYPRVVEFKNVAVDNRDGLYVVMEYLESDLRTYIKESKNIEAKGLMKQLLEGVKFLHDNGVMHRDLKPSNILIKKVNGSHELKICDFGLSRRFDDKVGPYTPKVGTLWYTAPELLLGAKTYSSAIDMWAVGCIMAELLLKEALFQEESEINLVVKIYEILARPNKKIWPEFPSLPGSKSTLIKRHRNVLRNKIPSAMLTKVGFDLLSKLLTCDPAKRITAEAALNHRWFRET